MRFIIYLIRRDINNFHEYARRERYRFFKQVADKYHATHFSNSTPRGRSLRNSNVSILFYQSTTFGLIGIEPISSYEGLNSYKTFNWAVTKERIYQYCDEYNVLYREDESKR